LCVVSLYIILQGVVSYAVGSTLVCDTLEEAQDLCFTKGERVKVVTLRGHSISKSGAMTGGSAASERVDRWEEREVDALRQRKAELESLLSQLTAQAPSRQQLLDLETRVRSLQSKVKLSETDIKVVEEKLAHLQQQKALRGENRVRVRKEIDVLGGEVRTLERNLAQVKKVVFCSPRCAVTMSFIQRSSECACAHTRNRLLHLKMFGPCPLVSILNMYV
jgi:structural maintenance of chromosome 1